MTHLAATVALLRDQPTGPQVYMVKRRWGNAFTAGAYVFVGGRVDSKDSDEDLLAHTEEFDGTRAARILGLSDAPSARSLFMAALRETFEESGVLVGQARGSRPTAGELAAARDDLNDGRCGFGEVLRRLDFALHPLELRYLAHWVTPPQESRRFDTRFFVCRLPPGQAAEVDRRESEEDTWIGLAEAVRAQREEQIKLAPPTYCVLEDLCAAPDVRSALALAPNGPIEAVHPELVQRAGQTVVLLPGDAEYRASAQIRGRHRVVRVGDHWERQRD